FVRKFFFGSRAFARQSSFSRAPSSVEFSHSQAASSLASTISAQTVISASSGPTLLNSPKKSVLETRRIMSEGVTLPPSTALEKKSSTDAGQNNSLTSTSLPDQGAPTCTHSFLY